MTEIDAASAISGMVAPAGFTVTAALAIALYGNLKGWWVAGYLYKAKCNECEYLRTRVDALSAAAERALDRLAADGQHGDPR